MPSLPHTGTWGTWDFGITEAIGDAFGLARNDQGGSQVTGTYDAGPTAVYKDQDTGVRGTLEQLYPSSGQVLGATDQKTTDTKTPAPTNNNGGNTGGSSGPDLSNPAKQTDYARSLGFSSWQEYQDYQNQQQQNSLMSQISELYAPALQRANEAYGRVRQGYDEDVTNLKNRVAQSLADYNTQGDELLTSTDREQSQFNKTLESALNQAVRAYNALSQRANVFYGGSTGTGQAMNELAAREYYRQQGNVQGKQAEGDLQFSDERGRIKTYIDSKVKDLDLYKQEALTSLEQNLRDQIAAIDSRKDEIEANKTRDKMGVLQSAMQRTQAIQDADRTFRQNLAMAGLNQLQEISGRVFTPQEIKAYLSEFQSDFNVDPTQVASSDTAAQIAQKPKTYEDEFATLNPAAAKQTQQNSATYTDYPAYGSYGSYLA